MLDKCKYEYIEYIKVQDSESCMGYNMPIETIMKGDEFYISPNFIFMYSKDTWTLEDSIKYNNGNWLFNGAVCYYSDKFVILKIKRTYTAKSNAFIRVKNLRTNVDFDIVTSNDTLTDGDIANLFII